MSVTGGPALAPLRILDLGCGPASSNLTTVWGVSESDKVTGVDLDERDLETARRRFPQHTYLLGRGESLPCEDASFDRVIAAGATYYMNIPKALAEIHRVLVPGGRISFGLLPASFTLAELRRYAFPHLKPTLFKLYVLGNGVWFYFTGKTLRFVNGRTEAFQTKRGMRIAFRRAGFVDPKFFCREGRMSEVLVVEARKLIS